MRIRKTTEYDAFCARAVRAAEIATFGIGGDDLGQSYRSAIRFVFGVLAVVIADARSMGLFGEAAQTIRNAALDGSAWDANTVKGSNVSLIDALSNIKLTVESLQESIAVILEPERELTLGIGYFDSIPFVWLSTLYEQMLALHPQVLAESGKVTLESDSRGRKKSGSFFTPPYLADYVISETVGRIEGAKYPRILDPSMGPGHFLLRTLNFLAKNGFNRRDAAECCLYGCDIDPIAVDIARFLVFAELDGRVDTSLIKNHLICADSLSNDGKFSWEKAFPNVFAGGGFDAVIGNPPYVAAKNGAIDSKRGKGQSDYYIQFLETVLEKNLVKAGGKFSMVLPDPFLVRSNAADIRRKLLSEWTMDGIIHISGAFPGALVANAVPICTNKPSKYTEFPAVRLDKLPLRQRFELDPHRTVLKTAVSVNREFALAQPSAEMLYLAGDGWIDVFRRIHGPGMSVSEIAKPFIRLKDMGVEIIFRGEEIGKKTIAEGNGELPILLGGESIRRYALNWDESKISREAVAKPREWYSGKKILLQKSTGKLVAAFDEEGYIVPQSIYGIKLRDGGYDPLYLLALLNSAFLNEYVFRAFTGYKLVQPQLEIEDIKRLPIRSISFSLSVEERAALAIEGQRAFNEGSPTLAGLVKDWLSTGKDDAIHDLLVFLARYAMDHKDDDSAVRVIDTVVEILYR